MRNSVRGEQVHTSKLNADDIKLIRECVEHRDKLKKELSQYTNKSLAEKFDVHIRTMEKAVSGFTWGHV